MHTGTSKEKKRRAVGFRPMADAIYFSVDLFGEHNQRETNVAPTESGSIPDEVESSQASKEQAIKPKNSENEKKFGCTSRNILNKLLEPASIRVKGRDCQSQATSTAKDQATKNKPSSNEASKKKSKRTKDKKTGPKSDGENTGRKIELSTKTSIT